MLYYPYFSTDTNEPGTSIEGRIEDIQETHSLNDANLVRAFERAFKIVGGLIALDFNWGIDDEFLADITDAISYERAKFRCFLLNAALAGANSYLDSIDTEQFGMEPVNYGPDAHEDDIRYATAEMLHLLTERLANVDEKELQKELRRIVAHLMPRIIEDFRRFELEQRGSGWIDRNDIVEKMRAWSHMDSQEIDDLIARKFGSLVMH